MTEIALEQPGKDANLVDSMLRCTGRDQLAKSKLIFYRDSVSLPACNANHDTPTASEGTDQPSSSCLSNALLCSVQVHQTKASDASQAPKVPTIRRGASCDQFSKRSGCNHQCLR